MLPIAASSPALAAASSQSPAGSSTPGQKALSSALPFHTFMRSADSADEKPARSRKKDEGEGLAPEAAVPAPIKEATPPRVWSLPQVISTMQISLATSGSPQPVESNRTESLEAVAGSQEAYGPTAPRIYSARAVSTLTSFAKPGNKYEDQPQADADMAARPQFVAPLPATETNIASRTSSEVPSPASAGSSAMRDMNPSANESGPISSNAPVQGSSPTVAGYVAFEGVLRDTYSAPKPIEASTRVNIPASGRSTRLGATPSEATAVPWVRGSLSSVLPNDGDEGQSTLPPADKLPMGNARDAQIQVHTSGLAEAAAGPLQADYDFSAPRKVGASQPAPQHTQPEAGSAPSPRAVNSAKRSESGSEQQTDTDHITSREIKPTPAQAALANSESGGLGIATSFTAPSAPVRDGQQESVPAPPSKAGPPDPPIPQAAIASASAPTAGIKLAINENGQRVELSVIERAGDIHVAVRTPDAQLASAMHEQLPALSSKLEQGGIHSEFWRPGAQAAGESKPIETAGNMASDSRQESGGRRQQQESQDSEKNPRQGLNRKSDRKEFSWLLESIR